jgi:hypothetical protein
VPHRHQGHKGPAKVAGSNKKVTVVTGPKTTIFLVLFDVLFRLRLPSPRKRKAQKTGPKNLIKMGFGFFVYFLSYLKKLFDTIFL